MSDAQTRIWLDILVANAQSFLETYDELVASMNKRSITRRSGYPVDRNAQVCLAIATTIRSSQDGAKKWDDSLPGFVLTNNFKLLRTAIEPLAEQITLVGEEVGSCYLPAHKALLALSKLTATINSIGCESVPRSLIGDFDKAEEIARYTEGLCHWDDLGKELTTAYYPPMEDITCEESICADVILSVVGSLMSDGMNQEIGLTMLSQVTQRHHQLVNTARERLFDTFKGKRRGCPSREVGDRIFYIMAQIQTLDHRSRALVSELCTQSAVIGKTVPRE